MTTQSNEQPSDVPNYFAIRWLAAVCGILMLLGASRTAAGQGITVLPVNVVMAPGQMAASLQVENNTGHTSAFQFRAFLWTEANGKDQLNPTAALLVSPPIATLPNGANQVVRLVLRQPPEGRESTYRILVDEIPPAAAPGTVRIALRLSIPVFAEPAVRVFPRDTWEIQSDGTQAWLVSTNRGNGHDTVRDVKLENSSGRTIGVQQGVLPYILPGATRRWRIDTRGQGLPPGTTLHLSAMTNTGKVEIPVRVDAGR